MTTPASSGRVARSASCASGGARTAATTSTRRLPICPIDHSKNLAVEAVSGRATLATYSINHQNWMPGPELPYVVAIVEIVEQPSVRLTTNLVNCPLDEIQIGMPLRDVRASPRSRRRRVPPAVRTRSGTRDGRQRDHRAARVHHRRRAVGDRSPAAPRSARAHARRLPGRDRRRRAHHRRHRRPLDVSRSDGSRRPASAVRARTR